MRVKYALFETWVTSTILLHRGEPWDARDPVVTSHPDWFGDSPPDPPRTSLPPVPGSAHPWGAYPPEEEQVPVEAATAAPGERRSLRRPRGDGQ